MSSKVEICNVALTLIRAARITDFDDGTDSGADCAALYDFVAKTVMAKGPWPSCVFRANLAQLSTVPANEYDFYYQLPTDPLCLRILSIDEEDPGETNYRVEGGGLVATNEDEMKIRYIGFVTDPELYDPYLEQAIVEYMAAYLSYKMTGQIRIFESALKMADQHVEDLLSKASLQGSAQDIGADTYIDVRRGTVR